jgi:hypothetical protein
VSRPPQTPPQEGLKNYNNLSIDFYRCFFIEIKNYLSKKYNLKYRLLFIICFISISANAQLTDREIYNLKGGRVKPDTSYIYHLPFANGNKYFLIQAYKSKFSHRNELSLDFKMKKGSKICAARDGIVTNQKKIVMLVD